MASEGRRKLIGDQRVVNRGLLAVADAAALPGGLSNRLAVSYCLIVM